MKQIFLLGVLALALHSTVSASSNIDFSTYSGGKLTGSKNGLTLSASVLVAVDGLNGGGLITGSDLGSVSFETGSLLSGSLQMGGTFAAGGSFTITGNGEGGVPNGSLFSGTFSAPVTWTVVTLANGTHSYTLTGTLSGTVGVVVRLTVNTGKGFFNGGSTISSGDTNVIIAEPSTLGLLGTGLISLAGLLRRKAQA